VHFLDSPPGQFAPSQVAIEQFCSRSVRKIARWQAQFVSGTDGEITRCQWSAYQPTMRVEVGVIFTALQVFDDKLGIAARTIASCMEGNGRQHLSSAGNRINDPPNRRGAAQWWKILAWGKNRIKPVA